MDGSGTKNRKPTISSHRSNARHFPYNPSELFSSFIINSPIKGFDWRIKAFVCAIISFDWRIRSFDWKKHTGIWLSVPTYIKKVVCVADNLSLKKYHTPRSYEYFRICPGRSTVLREIPFNLHSLSMVVPHFAAIRESVSPDFTR